MDDDLSDLLAQHWSHDAGPRPGFGSTGTPVQYGQGTVVAWDPDTGSNQIRYHGSTLRNLPIISSTDILVMRPGDQVAIMAWAPNGGSGAYFIMGRLVVPGSEAATRSIQFMQGELAKSISAEVFAERVHNAVVAGTAGTTSTSFTDLSDEVGPVVSNVTISDAGKALVYLSGALIPPASDSAVMSFTVSGATSLAADDFRSLAALRSAELIAVTCSIIIPLTLNPGSHTFTAKYKSDSGGSAGFSNRGITVIAL